MSKKITLFAPDGGTRLVFENIELIRYSDDVVEFSTRQDVAGTDKVLLTDYTSNLPYLIAESTSGSKDLL